MMKKTLMAAALGATAIAGIAYAAQPAPAPAGTTAPAPPRPMADGVLTREETMAQADKRFDRLDYDRDGKVSMETMMAAHAKRGGPGMRGRGGHGGRHGMRGGPGGPDHGPRGMRGGPDGPDGGPHGMRGDTGGPDDMMASPPPAAGAKQMGPVERAAQMRTIANERFRTLDTNRDGWLDRAEFRAQAAQRFGTLDANKDGKVDAAERFAAREKMREMWKAKRAAK